MYFYTVFSSQFIFMTIKVKLDRKRMVYSKVRFFIFMWLMVSISANAQTNKKTYNIVRTDTPPKIDAVFNDPVWQIAEEAKDFVMFRPGNGTPEPDDKKTVVKLAYDNTGIYVAATMYDNEPGKIDRQFSTRDNISQADFFIITLNPYNDGINDLEFYVNCAGTQADAKVTTANGEDWNWSAVWDSAARISDQGWHVEMFIPFSALRFSNSNINDWGLNFHRRITSTKEQYTWNPIDKSEGNIMEHAGLLRGLKDIDAPIRLSFYPYAQASIDKYQNDYSPRLSGGMDIKYGINDSFTLDATLIPDFGQTAYDDVVLNLSPFEQEYDEKRAFFTEGTEMFSKGYLLYFRRIGEQPINYYSAENNLAENEEIIENPDKTKLLNAIKFSGRTNSGLGIGLFNAVTQQSEAIIRNGTDNSIRKELTSPWTNYSAVVIDQLFKNTSSLTFVNSNVMRAGSYRDANVSSLLADVRLFDNKYSFSTDMSLSNLFYTDNVDTGFQGDIGFSKISGAHRFGIYADMSDTHYNKNDFGIQPYNNFASLNLNYNYRIFEPTKHLNQLFLQINYSHSRLYKPSTYTGNYLNLKSSFTNKKEFSYGGRLNFRLGNEKDYHEPRVENRFIKYDPAYGISTWISSDYRKKFALDIHLNIFNEIGDFLPLRYTEISIKPRIRLTDQLNLLFEYEFDHSKNNKGFVNVIDDNIIFGNRLIKSHIGSTKITYNFSPKAALNLSARYNWTPVIYDNQFYVLNTDGTLTENIYTNNHNQNFNIWNFDLSYQWEFAPGSLLTALYRNAKYDNNMVAHINMNDNLNQFFSLPANHQLSLKLTYYLDYNTLKNKFF